MERGGFIYIMTNKHKNVLYIGITSNLQSRVYEHRQQVYPNSFTAQYNVEYLIYYEGFRHIEEAIAREKQLKKWSRKKKDMLINKLNPAWQDLYSEVMNDVYSLL